MENVTTIMKKRKWEIWVNGPTHEGVINKCVALFEDNAARAELYLQYAEDSYGPKCEITLKTKSGEVFKLDAKRILMAVQ